MKLLFLMLLVCCSFLVLTFSFLALAQAPGADVDPNALVPQLIGAIQGRNWIVVVCLVTILVVWLARKLPIPFLKTDRGGAILVMALGIATALLAALAGGAPMTLSLIIGSVVSAVTAAGGFNVFNKIFFPSDTPEAKAAAAGVEAAKNPTIPLNR